MTPSPIMDGHHSVIFWMEILCLTINYSPACVPGLSHHIKVPACLLLPHKLCTSKKTRSLNYHAFLGHRNQIQKNLSVMEAGVLQRACSNVAWFTFQPQLQKLSLHEVKTHLKIHKQDCWFQPSGPDFYPLLFWDANG